MQLRNNYKPSIKEIRLVSYCIHNVGFVIYPERKKSGELSIILMYKNERLEFSEGITDKNIGHAIFLAYKKYYQRIYENGTILDVPKEPGVANNIPQDAIKNMDLSHQIRLIL